MSGEVVWEGWVAGKRTCLYKRNVHVNDIVGNDDLSAAHRARQIFDFLTSCHFSAARIPLRNSISLGLRVKTGSQDKCYLRNQSLKVPTDQQRNDDGSRDIVGKIKFRVTWRICEVLCRHNGAVATCVSLLCTGPSRYQPMLKWN